MNCESRERTARARMDMFMRAAIEEAEQGLAEGGIPIGSVLVHAARSSAAATTAACSRAARSCTARWTRSSAPAGSRRRSTASARSTRRCRRARCAAARFCCTASRRDRRREPDVHGRGGPPEIERCRGSGARRSAVCRVDERVYREESGGVGGGYRGVVQGAVTVQGCRLRRSP